MAGLTLGGGFGWLSRKYGMTVDNLLSADVVTADGRQVRASETENADLFWGLRGGGGNFGVVTSFEFQLHPVGPNVLSGLIVYPFDQAKSVLTQFARFTETMPDELNVWMVTRKAPPLPFLPADVHGKEIVALALCYAGDPAAGEKLIEPLRKFGTPLGEHVGVQPYTAWQQAFDPLLAPGARNYWKSHNFSELSDGAIDTIIKYAGALPSPQCEIFIGTIGGQTTARRARRDGLLEPRCQVRDERARPLGFGRRGRARHRLGARVLRQVTAVCQRRRLHQLPHAGGGRPHRVRLRRDLQAAGRGEEEIRPDESLPDEPEHQAGLRSEDGQPPTAATNSPGTWRDARPGDTSPASRRSGGVVDMASTEWWQRGPIENVPAVLQPVAHILLQVRESVGEMVDGLTEAEWNRRPGGVASAAFHVRHIAGVIDRLFTYARGEALSAEQLAAIPLEGSPLAAEDVPEALETLSTRIDAALAELKTVDVDTLGDFRGVGRAQLPSTVIGCLVHGAEHAMRHVGQLSVTVRIARSNSLA